MVSVFLIAVSLSVDAVAAAVCCGLSVPEFSWKQGLRLSLWFGGFQAGMTLIGGLIGDRLNQYYQYLGGIVAFGLLTYLGGGMLLEAMRPLEGESKVKELSTRTVVELALATSLDALAVGVSVVFLEVGIWTAAGIIGGVTVVLTGIGGRIGSRLGQRFYRWASAGGGMVLTGIGVKVLWGVIGCGAVR